MGLEPDFFVHKFVEEVVEKISTINEVFKKQMVFVQISYENFATKHKQNVPSYVVNNEM